MDTVEHWRDVWSSAPAEARSWFQEDPHLSLELIQRFAPDRTAAILDVGGGASRLVDHLLALGYRDLTVVDIADEALALTRERLEEQADLVTFEVAEVTRLELLRPVDLWHDRAVLHFLIDPADQAAYSRRLHAALRPGGHAVIAAFGPAGPERCSGLPVHRYDAQELARTLGLELVESHAEAHRTPDDREQAFVYAVLRRPVLP